MQPPMGQSQIRLVFYVGPGSELPAGGFLLAADEVGIDAGLGDQRLVLALLDDFAVVQYQDLVGVAYGFQPVGDHQNGLVPGQGLDGLLQPILVLRVTLAVASSRMMMGASFSMARAMAIRCHSPPDRCAPPPPTGVS